MNSGIIILLLVFIVNIVFYIIPKTFPRLSFLDVLMFQIFINCLFLFYFILPQSHSTINLSE